MRTRSTRRADRALLLRRYPYGESSLVVHLITPRHGRLAILAKGAYRPKSGFFGVLDLFDTLQVAWSQRPTSELGILTGASIETRRRPLSANLERYRTALSILELAALGARAGEGDPELFQLTEEALEALARTDVEPALALVAYDLRFLRAMGLTPALDTCASCGRSETVRDPVRVPFSAARGGRLCMPCADTERAAGRHLEGHPLKWMRIARSLLDPPLGHLARIHLEADVIAGVRELTERFLEVHLDSQLKTRAHGRRGAIPLQRRTPHREARR